ncbi:MHO_1590 family protein [Mycoplasmopsis lipofaciens]|uniref:MHO_1590 family protein n=1 Tax=Mycoplasmopsis lipofaciens TaxID=114884 RepID=UPI00068EB061|nr:hypothetical protein [Mycoplasmopsis lipofaciens]
MKNKNKILWSLIGTTVGLATITPIIVISAKKYKNNRIDIIENNQLATFPKLNNSNYYKYIRILNDKPCFASDFIANVVKDILQNMYIPSGNVEFYYDKTNEQSITFYFKWTSGNSIIKKQYSFDIQDLLTNNKNRQQN